uniref:Uncharacterized protein n=1 Tax=Panagrolaimus superbus TaxID=310955 RepID=A0A914YGV5_9BILA
MIKATIGDSVSTTAASSSLKLGEGINETPDDVDVKELIALAHHKNYHHKETATPKFNTVTPQPSADSESLKVAHPDTFQPHDTAHFGNLRYLDFAPESKDKQFSTTETPSEEETSESLLLPETANNNNNNQQQQQQQLPPNPYFLALANNPIKSSIG